MNDAPRKQMATLHFPALSSAVRAASKSGSVAEDTLSVTLSALGVHIATSV